MCFHDFSLVLDVRNVVKAAVCFSNGKILWISIVLHYVCFYLFPVFFYIYLRLPLI